MARRRLKASVNRAWVYTYANVEFEYNLANMATEGVLIGFEDIESDEPMLTRETSEYYFERLLIWWQPYFVRPSLLTGSAPMSMHRLGVLNDSVDMGISEAPQAAAENFDRILQEQVIWNVPYSGLTYDGGAVSVSTEATADFQGFPMKPPNYCWDLSSKFSLREDTSLVWQISTSPDFGAADESHSFGADIVVKALLRRRQR